MCVWVCSSCSSSVFPLRSCHLFFSLLITFFSVDTTNKKPHRLVCNHIYAMTYTFQSEFRSNVYWMSRFMLFKHTHAWRRGPSKQKKNNIVYLHTSRKFGKIITIEGKMFNVFIFLLLYVSSLVHCGIQIFIFFLSHFNNLYMFFFLGNSKDLFTNIFRSELLR